MFQYFGDALHRHALAERHRGESVPCQVEGEVLLDAANIRNLLEIRIGLLIGQDGEELAPL